MEIQFGRHHGKVARGLRSFLYLGIFEIISVFEINYWIMNHLVFKNINISNLIYHTCFVFSDLIKTSKKKEE